MRNSKRFRQPTLTEVGGVLGVASKTGAVEGAWCVLTRGESGTGTAGAIALIHVLTAALALPALLAHARSVRAIARLCPGRVARAVVLAVGAPRVPGTFCTQRDIISFEASQITT